MENLSESSKMSDDEGDVQLIETGDSIKVKQVLDECVIEAVSESNYHNEFLRNIPFPNLLFRIF